MLTRLVRKGNNNAVARSFFWGKTTPAQVSSAAPSVVPEHDIVERVKKTHDENRSVIDQIRDHAVIDYKEYPKASHWDKNSPDYVPAPRDEENTYKAIDAFNRTIDDLKHSLKLQEEIYTMIENLDRPYLRGKKGTETNVYNEVKDYSNPLGHNFRSEKEMEMEELAKGANKHRFINDVIFTPKWTQELSNYKSWDQEIENRPVNSHFHADKGYKFDVGVPYEQRYPHVADRLGCPELLGSGWDRLFRLENEYLHPNFLDQPFVQTPPIDADKDLNFSEGEVIYENPNVIEWAKLSHTTGAFALFFYAVWKPYHTLVASPIPSPSVFDELSLPYFNMNTYAFDNYNLSAWMIPAIAYVVTDVIMRRIDTICNKFAKRVQYNADKELLFITVPGMLGKEVEKVVELEHCEIEVPYVNIGVKYMSAQDEDGFFILKDMNKDEVYFLNKRQT